MKPLVKAALAAALLAAAGQPQAPPPSFDPAKPPPSRSAQPGERLCRAGDLPVGPNGACVHLADGDGHTGSSRQQRMTRDRRRPLRLGLRAAGDSIPLLPGRSIELNNYQLPIMPNDNAAWHDGQQPYDHDNGSFLIIEAAAGAEVKLVALEGQVGPARILLVGELHGVTVAVRHTLTGPAGEEHIIALYSQLGKPGPAVVNGARIADGDTIGYLTTDTRRQPALRLQLRRERSDSRGVAHLSRLLLPTVSIPLDPRNALPPRLP